MDGIERGQGPGALRLAELVVGEPGLPVERRQPGHGRRVGTDQLEDPQRELRGRLPRPALDPDLGRLGLEPAPGLDDGVPGGADEEQLALGRGSRGESLGQHLRVAEHVEGDVDRPRVGTAARPPGLVGPADPAVERVGGRPREQQLGHQRDEAQEVVVAGRALEGALDVVDGRAVRGRARRRRLGGGGPHRLQALTGQHAARPDRGRPGHEQRHQQDAAHDRSDGRDRRAPGPHAARTYSGSRSGWVTLRSRGGTA